MPSRTREMCYKLRTELLEALYGIRREVITPHSGRALKSGDKPPAHDSIENILQAHNIAVLLPVINWISRAIKGLQRGELEPPVVGSGVAR